MDVEGFCDAWLAAWTGGDVERLVSFYAEDCLYSDPSRPAGVRGKEALRRYLSKWLPDYAEMVWAREAVFPTTGGFCLTWTAHIPVRGAWLTERGMDLVLLDAAGKISRNDVYFDMSAWRARLQS